MNTFDQKCYDLAEYFLPDGSDKQREKLAAMIQYAVEEFDWLPTKDDDVIGEP